MEAGLKRSDAQLFETDGESVVEPDKAAGKSITKVSPAKQLSITKCPSSRSQVRQQAGLRRKAWTSQAKATRAAKGKGGEQDEGKS